MKTNTKDLKNLLIKNGILGSKDSINLTDVPINNRKKREHRNKETYLWINNELKYIISDTRLGPINYKSYCLIKKHCADLVCKVIKLPDKDQCVYLTEYFEGQTINNALKSGAITKSDYIGFGEKVFKNLGITEDESTALKAEKEYNKVLKKINAIDIIEDFDKKLLNYLAGPIFNNLIKDIKPTTRITSGDFHGNNILINKKGILKLVDLELLERTHFYEEDLVRFNHFSNIDLKDRIKKLYIGDRYDSFEFFFLLKQIVIEYELSSPYLFFKNWPRKIERIVNIAKELELFSKESILNIITPDNRGDLDKWQIFWKVDDKFTEENSIVGQFEPNSNVTVEFDLNQFVKPVQIRFDPSTVVGEVTFDKIFLRERNNNRKFVDIERSSIFGDGDIVEIDKKNGRYLSIGGDPRINLPEIKPRFDKLVIHLRYKQQLISVKEISEKLKQIDLSRLKRERDFQDLESKFSLYEKKKEGDIKILEGFKSKVSEILKDLSFKGSNGENTDESLKFINDHIKGNEIALNKSTDLNKINKEKISKLETKIKNQQKESGLKDKNLTKLLLEVKRLEKKTSYFGAKIDNNNLKLQEAKGEGDRYLTELRKLEKINSSLEAKLGNVNLESQYIKEERNGYLVEIKRLEKINSSLETKLEKSVFEVNERRNETETKLLELQTLAKHNSLLEAKLKKSDSDLDNLKIETKECFVESRKVEKINSSLEAKLEKNDTELAGLKNERKEFLLELRKLEKINSSLEAKLEKNDTELAGLKNERKEFLLESRKLEKINSSLEAKLEKNDSELAGLKNERKEFLLELRKLEKINSTLATKLEKSCFELKNREDLVNNNLSDIKKLEKDNNMFVATLQKNDSELNDLKRQRKQGLLDLNKLRKTNVLLERELEITEKNSVHLNQKLNEKIKIIKEQFIKIKEYEQNNKKASSDLRNLEKEKFNINEELAESKSLIESQKEKINISLKENAQIYKEIKILRKFSFNIQNKLSNKADSLNLALREKEKQRIALNKTVQETEILKEKKEEIRGKYESLKKQYNTVDSRVDFLQEANRNNKLAYLKYKSMYNNITNKAGYNFLKKLKIV